MGRVVVGIGGACAMAVTKVSEAGRCCRPTSRV